MKFVISAAAYQKQLKQGDRSDAGRILQRAHACDALSRKMQKIGIDPYFAGNSLPVKGREFEQFATYITRGELRYFRDKHWLSRADLARSLGVNEMQIRRWLAEGKNPDDFLPVTKKDFERLEAEYPDDKKGGRWRAVIKKAGLQ